MPSIDINATLSAQGFTNARPVTDTPSIAQFWPDQRCGIYCLYFTNGDYYLGQSIEVTKRFLAHRQTWDDISAITFKMVEREKLNKEEERLIKLLEREGFPLRNIVHTTPGQVPFGMADFDVFMPAENQERWLTDQTYIDKSGQRLVNDAQRAKYTRKYQLLLKQPYADEIIQVLREYVQIGIPAYIQSEMNFWVCTCPIKKESPDHKVLSRININWQLVVQASLFKGKPLFSFFVAKSAIQQNSKIRELLFHLRLISHGGWAFNNQLKPGGQDQTYFQIRGVDGARAMLANPLMKQAIREFNMRLIRKGPTVSSKFHCFDLADRLVEGDTDIL